MYAKCPACGRLVALNGPLVTDCVDGHEWHPELEWEYKRRATFVRYHLARFADG